jgi:hypothetical protein
MGIIYVSDGYNTRVRWLYYTCQMGIIYVSDDGIIYVSDDGIIYVSDGYNIRVRWVYYTCHMSSHLAPTVHSSQSPDQQVKEQNRGLLPYVGVESRVIALCGSRIEGYCLMWE